MTAAAQTMIHVADQGTLADAITSATFGSTIVFDNNITLTSANLPTIDKDLTIDGNNFALSGNNQFRGLVVVGNGESGADVRIQNLTIQNTVATGGAGSNGSAGGGGGAGAGAALFISSQSPSTTRVTVSNVNLLSNTAVGGAGKTATGGIVGGAGGGFNGGSGGGLGGSGTSSANGGSGAVGGGGGGAGIAATGQTGGSSSFGGGAGGSTDGSPVPGGFGGGSNGGTTSGGGGGAFGGAVFVQDNDSELIIEDAFTVNGNLVAGGAGGDGASAGSGYGAGLFLREYGHLEISTDSSITIADPIVDGFGAGDSGGGSWGITKTGSGTLVLAGNNAFVGQTRIEAGTLSVASNANLGSSSELLIYDGTTLAITGSDAYTPFVGISGLSTVRVSPAVTATWNAPIADLDSFTPATLNVSGGGTLALADSTNSYSGGTIVTGNSVVSVGDDAALGASAAGVTLGDASSAGTLAITTSGAFSSSRPFTLGGGGGTINTSSTTDATLGGAIGGVGGLTKDGAGWLTLSSVNTYAGTTSVVAGRLIAGAANAFGSAPSLAVGAFGTVDFGGYDYSLNALSGTGAVLVSGGATMTLGANNSDVTFGGTIGGDGGIAKEGAGTLVLSGNSSYSSGTSINAGIVSIASNANLGAGSVAMFDGSTLALTGSDTYTHNTSLSGTATFRTSPAITATWNGVMSDYFSSLPSDTGPISVPGGLNVTGGGTLVLGNTGNSFSLGTTVSGNSTVGVSADGALGTGGGVTLGDASSSGTLAITGVFSSSRPFSLGAGGGTINTTAGTGATLSGIIGGAGGLTKDGTGTLTLSGANTYAGTTSVNAGTLFAGASNVFGSAPSLVIGAFATVDFGGFSQSIDALSGTGTLQLSGGASLTLGTNNRDNSFGGSIGGTGGIVKNGTGTLTLSGSNSFSGGIAVNGGTLSVGADASLGGAGAVSMAEATTLALTGGGRFAHELQLAGDPLVTVGSGHAVTWTGLVSDGVSSGTLEISGGGTLGLTNRANTYSGGTIVTGGSTVLVGADGALGAAGGGIALGNTTTAATLGIEAPTPFLSSRPITVGALGATIDAIGGTNATLNGAISGAGGLTKTGTGTLTLGGANTYAGPTVAAAGTVRAGATNAFGTSGSLGVVSGATVDLNGFSQAFNALSGTGTIALGGGALLALGGGGADIVFGGSLTGTGALVKDGGGSLTLTGGNDYRGGTTVNDGTLFGTTTSLQGDMLNNAAVVFDQAANGTFAGSMSGTGTLEKAGAGTLTLAGTNTYSGGTLISAGALVGDSSSLQGTVVNQGTLIFDHAGIGTFDGTICGTGAVTKSGPGTLSISGAHPFSGTLSIGQGTLALNGGVGGHVNVAPGAILRGAGSIGGSLNLGGSLSVAAPGTSAASFNARRLGLEPAQAAAAPSLVINGNLTAIPGSTLDFTVTPTGATPIVVNGLASLTGTHVNIGVNDPNPARYATYVGLTSGGLTVNGIDASSATPGIVPVLKYDPHSMFVTLLNENIPLGGVVSNPNAAGAGGAIDRIKPGATGDLAFVVRELTALDDQSLNHALRLLSGELHSSEQRLTVDESVAMTDLVRAALDDRDNEDDDAKRLTGRQTVRWWFQLTGEHAHFSPAGYDSAITNTGGGGGGFDLRPFPRVTAGGGGSFSRAGLSMEGLGGSSDMQAPRAFGYAGYSAGPFLFNGGGSTARTSYTTTRPIAFKANVPSPNGEEPLSGGVDRLADAEQTGVTRDAWTEWKDTIRRGSWTYNWKIGYRAATYDRNPFAETGAGTISLTGLTQVLETREADVNIHVFRRGGAWRPRMFVSYRRQLGDLATRSDVQIGDQPAGQFIVDGVPLPQDELHGIFGLTMRSALGLEYTLEYEIRKSKDENHQGLHFRVRFN